MTFTVIVTSAAQAAIARQLLPACDRIAQGACRVYFFYQTNGGGKNHTYADLDGEPLVASYAFATLAEAEAWVRDDMRRAS